MSNRSLQACSWATGIENASFGVWDLDLGLDRVHYSPLWKARLGFPRLDASDSSAFWRCRVHPDDFDPMLHALRSHLDGCTPTYEATFRLRSNGSGYRTMRSRGRVVARDPLGAAARMVGTMVDLTGWPSSAARYGLAIDPPAEEARLLRLPFHAVVGSAGHEQADHHLIDLTDDLLDAALREANAAP